MTPIIKTNPFETVKVLHLNKEMMMMSPTAAGVLSQGWASKADTELHSVTVFTEEGIQKEFTAKLRQMQHPLCTKGKGTGRAFK